LNTAQPAAATRAPARAPRDQVEESAAEETLRHHANRLVRSRLSAAACAVLDPCISLLQRLRAGAGGAQDADANADEDSPRSRNARPGRGRDALAGAEEGEAEAEAPKPKRRLLTFLIYFSVLLAGGMAGGALAYELLAKLLERQAMESRRVEAAALKQSKSVASNQKKLDEAQAKLAEAETKLEEAQKKQIEAEKNLEAALNDTKAAAEKQKKFDEAVKLLESIGGADRSGNAQRSPAISRNSAESKQRPLKSGDCTLAASGINALKDCVKDFNR
jgi:hypothetical protein